MAFSTKTRLPIAQLQPSIDKDDIYIQGVITLIWPYSASKQTWSFLLVEPDFRLRRKRGQVRVSFHGACARRTARCGLASGDKINLAIAGAQWAEDAAKDQTPGKSVDWELSFEEQVVLAKLAKGQEPVLVDTERMSPSPEPDRSFLSPTPPETPNGAVHTPVNRIIPQLKAVNGTWSSPAFLTDKLYPTINVLGRAADPFWDDEGAWEEGRPTKRAKFGRASGEWRFVERTPSPDPEVVEEIMIEDSREEDVTRPQIARSELAGEIVLEENRESQDIERPHKDVPVPEIGKVVKLIRQSREALVGAEDDVEMLDVDTNEVQDQPSEDQAKVTAGDESQGHDREPLRTEPKQQERSVSIETEIISDLPDRNGIETVSFTTEVSPDLPARGRSPIVSLAISVQESFQDGQRIADAQPHSSPHIDLASSPQLASSPPLRPEQMASFRQKSPILHIEVEGATPRIDNIPDDKTETPETPRLEPLASPSLAVVSPLEAQPQAQATYFSDQQQAHDEDQQALQPAAQIQVHEDTTNRLDIGQKIAEQEMSHHKHSDSSSSFATQQSNGEIAGLPLADDEVPRKRPSSVDELFEAPSGESREVSHEEASIGAEKHATEDGSSPIALIDVGESDTNHTDGTQPDVRSLRPRLIESPKRQGQYYDTFSHRPVETKARNEADEPDGETHIPAQLELVISEQVTKIENEASVEDPSTYTSRPPLQKQDTLFEHMMEIFDPSSLYPSTVEDSETQRIDNDTTMEDVDSMVRDSAAVDAHADAIFQDHQIHQANSLLEAGEPVLVDHVRARQDDSGPAEDLQAKKKITAVESEEKSSSSDVKDDPIVADQEDTMLNEDPLVGSFTKESQEKMAMTSGASKTLTSPRIQQTKREGRHEILDTYYEEEIELPHSSMIDDVTSQPNPEIIDLIGGDELDTSPSVAGEPKEKAQGIVEGDPAKVTSDDYEEYAEDYSVQEKMEPKESVEETEESEVEESQPQFTMPSSLPSTPQKSRPLTRAQSKLQAATASSDFPEEEEELSETPVKTRDFATTYPHTPELSQRVEVVSSPTPTPDLQRHAEPSLPTPRLTQKSIGDLNETSQSQEYHTAPTDLLQSQDSNQSQITPKAIAFQEMPSFSYSQLSQEPPSEDNQLGPLSQQPPSSPPAQLKPNPKPISTNVTQFAMAETPVHPSTGFRTPISYYASLPTLHQHFHELMDTLTICVSATKTIRAKSGPRDYTQTLYLSDPSSSTSASPITTAQLFRPYARALPGPNPGDVVLLRAFKVQALKHKMMLVSTAESAWAVWRKDIIEEAARMEVKGPPVEIGAEERGVVRGLRAWWGSLDDGFRRGIEEKVPGWVKDKANQVEREGNEGVVKDKEFDRKGKNEESGKKGQGMGKGKETDVNGHAEEEIQLVKKGKINKAEAKVQPKKSDSDREEVEKAQKEKKSLEGRTKIKKEKQSPPPVRSSPRKAVKEVMMENMKGGPAHRLRSGTKYSDETAPRPRSRGKGSTSAATVHELRDGTKWRDEGV